MHLRRVPFCFISVIIFSAFAIQLSNCRPQELQVVRPAHFLPKGFFAHSPSGRDGHLVPDSFYRGASDVNPLPGGGNREEIPPENNNIPIAPSDSGFGSPGQGQQSVDSYTNIGSSNNGDTSVSNAGDYGETVPGQTSNLVPASASYASYSESN